MRIKFTFEADEGKVILPINYNRALQSFIYRNITPELSNFLHNKGFKFDKRSFKLFTFSRILGKEYRILKDKKMIEFKTPISFYLSTIYPPVAEEFTSSIIKLNEVVLWKNRLYVSSIEVFTKKFNKEKILIKMLSPITIYSTLKKPDGKKKTYYYSPFEKEFSELIEKNIIKKYISYYREEPSEVKFRIKPLKVSEKRNLITTFYKGTVIKGWTGIYEIEGGKELIEFSYSTGIGAKNSQGFGMWEEIKL